ncbi:CARD- and ANK-domain containing inflammasome adapter protein [Callorhinchus milii]|uniref:CARD- and ANK-domain containing inflammasome adapter protein n=1 Tax=Callorhinchus milii TaxID=7868 RepID=UPI001C3FC04A|nr:CARD- and ANK-domain containing inflammasome adapter protein [Callorhinchus milii]
MVLMHPTGIFTNPYAIEVLQRKKSELVAGIANTDHLLDWLIENGLVSADKRLAVSSYRTREEKNARLLEMLVSRGERACRLFFYPCLKRVEPALYNQIRSYVSEVSGSFGDARRQLVGYLLERDKDEVPRSRRQREEEEEVAPSSRPVKPKPREPVKPRDSEELYRAAAQGDLPGLERALQDADVNAINASNETLLHVAAAHGHAVMVSYLLSQGAKMEARDSKGRSPLHRAAEEGQAEAIRALLAAGAHIYAMDSDSQTPLHLAAPHQSHSAVVKLMLREEGKRADCKSSFLHMAAQRDESGFARTLLRHGAPVDAKDGRRHQTPLFYAVSRGHINTAKVLLEAGAQVVDGAGLIDAAFSTGDQALIALMLTQAREVGPATIFRAVERDLPKVVAALAEMGADVNSRDGSGRTPLLMAAERGMAECATVLLEKGAQLRDRAPDLSSALHLAVMSDSPSLVHLLLEKGMDPNITGAGEQTPLHLAARHDRYKMVDVLIGAGSKPNSAAVLGATPLHVASRWGSRQAAERLIANKADINAKDRDARRPLHLAALVGDTPMADLLLSNHADANPLDKEKKTPLHLAASEGHLDFVSLMLIRKGKFGAKDMDGNTPMLYAASKGHTSVVKAFLLAGRNHNVNDKNVWRRTALHLAAEHGSEDLVELLLMSGGAIDALDNAKDTPLHCACRSGNVGAAHRLANWAGGQKAKFHVTNNVRKTPLQVSESGDSDGHRQIVVLLRKKMMLTR